MMCEVCDQSSWRYKCPACLAKTCSLDCVKAHKAQKSCSGQRDKTAFVSIKSFNETNLLSDYRFLEDVNRKTDSTTRDPLRNKRRSSYFFLENMRKKASQREMTWLLLPSGLSKRQQNMTRVFKGKLFIWHIEWLFPMAQAKYTDRQPESAVISDSLRQFFSGDSVLPHVQHALRGYSGQEADVELLMKVPKRPANDPRFYKLDADLTFREAFRRKTILEFPSIHIVPASKAENYPLLEEDSNESLVDDSDNEEDPLVEESDGAPPEKKAKVVGDRSLLRDSYNDYLELNPDAGNWDVMLKKGIPENWQDYGKSQRGNKSKHQQPDVGNDNIVDTHKIDLAPAVDPELRPNIAHTDVGHGSGDSDSDEDLSLVVEEDTVSSAKIIDQSECGLKGSSSEYKFGHMLESSESVKISNHGHFLESIATSDKTNDSKVCDRIATSSSSGTDCLKTDSRTEVGLEISDSHIVGTEASQNTVDNDRSTVQSPGHVPSSVPMNQSNPTSLSVVADALQPVSHQGEESLGITREITIKDEVDDERTIWITKL